MTSLQTNKCLANTVDNNKREDEGGGGHSELLQESSQSSSSSSSSLPPPPSSTTTTTTPPTTTTIIQQTTSTSKSMQLQHEQEPVKTSANTSVITDYNKTNENDSFGIMLEIFVEHVNQQQQRELDQQLRDRRLSLPADSIELATLNGVVMRRKQQLQLRYQQQLLSSASNSTNNINTNTNNNNNNNNTNCTTGNINELTKQQSTPQTAMSPAINRVTKVSMRDNRPLSISSISSATSSGSSSSSNSSASSGIHSSITSNGTITQRVVTEIIETERTYVDDLEQIVTGYLCYLRNVLKQQQKHQHQQHQQPQHYKQDQHEQEDQAEQQIDSEAMVINKITTDDDNNNNNNNDDNKSMFVFDDDTTSATNDEGVDDCDVECEGDSDDLVLSARSQASLQLNSSNNNNNNINLNTIKDNEPKHSASQASSVSVQQTPDNTPCNVNRQIRRQTTLQDNSNGSFIITPSHIRNLFSNLEDIYKFNKDLLFRLEECYLNPGSVAECFVENASGFEVYTHYCTTYPQVVSTLTELMSNQTAAQTLKERQTKLNQGLPLGAYLLKPVQRILKYHILFQSLIKHTSDEDSVNEKDKQLINEAFNVMTSIASHINSMKKRHEHAVRVQEVQGLLCGWEGPDLTTLGELILEDTFKLYNRPKSTRHLFLFDNVLLITKKKRDGSLCYKDHIAVSSRKVDYTRLDCWDELKITN